MDNSCKTSYMSDENIVLLQMQVKGRLRSRYLASQTPLLSLDYAVSVEPTTRLFWFSFTSLFSSCSFVSKGSSSGILVTSI